MPATVFCIEFAKWQARCLIVWLMESILRAFTPNRRKLLKGWGGTSIPDCASSFLYDYLYVRLAAVQIFKRWFQVLDSNPCC